MVQINKVRGTVADLTQTVTAFQGTKNDRDFLYLDEMLTRALLQLDNVDPDGCDDVRQARKAVIKDINAAISKLESLAKDPGTSTPKATCEDPQKSPTGEQDPATSAPPAPPAPQQEAEEKSAEKMEVEKQEESAVRSADGTPDVSNT